MKTRIMYGRKQEGIIKQALLYCTYITRNLLRFELAASLIKKIVFFTLPVPTASVQCGTITA
jgi:hypothetical protein